MSSHFYTEHRPTHSLQLYARTPLNTRKMITTPLTFGIELEFLAIFLTSIVWPNPRYSEDLSGGCGAAIYYALLRAGIPATGWQPEDEGFQDDAAPYTRWAVDTDCLRLSPAEEALLPDGFEVESIELTSRVFNFQTPSWFHEIGRVLTVLARLETWTGCRFIANASTDLHVHVGNGVGSKIPLQTAKNVLMLLTAFERCFDEIHTINRIGFPQDYSFGFSHAPLSFFHTNNGSAADSTLFDWLAHIQYQNSYEGLGSLFTLPGGNAVFPDIVEKSTYGHNSSANIENLFEDEEMERYEEQLTGTIEFRQHTGTLDLLDIVAWVSLTVRLVDYSAEVSDMEMLTLCARGVDVSFGLQGVLTAIGCHPDLLAHYRGDGPFGLAMIGTATGAIQSSKLDLLLAQNEIEQGQRSDPQAVRATIASKSYGLDPAISMVSVPVEAIQRYFQVAVLNVSSRIAPGTMLTDSQHIVSPAKSCVLKHLSELYRGKAHEMSYEAELAATGPVALFARSAEMVKDADAIMEMESEA
ncbi:hypothetical protein LTR17_000070 [Elasticomyces elasticus]|nr:hypothetical protein LTR17_000070 [Elasticomyces elasticus]